MTSFSIGSPDANVKLWLDKFFVNIANQGEEHAPTFVCLASDGDGNLHAIQSPHLPLGPAFSRFLADVAGFIRAVPGVIDACAIVRGDSIHWPNVMPLQDFETRDAYMERLKPVVERLMERHGTDFSQWPRDYRTAQVCFFYRSKYGEERAGLQKYDWLPNADSDGLHIEREPVITPELGDFGVLSAGFLECLKIGLEEA